MGLLRAGAIPEQDHRQVSKAPRAQGDKCHPDAGETAAIAGASQGAVQAVRGSVAPNVQIRQRESSIADVVKSLARQLSSSRSQEPTSVHGLPPRPSSNGGHQRQPCFQAVRRPCRSHPFQVAANQESLDSRSVHLHLNLQPGVCDTVRWIKARNLDE